jgi:hypothetical protein
MTQSIGSFARNIIATRSDLTNAQVLALVKEQFKDAKTSLACIAWYKSNMKKTGYKAATVVIERTTDVIEAEIAAMRDKLELLEEELEMKQNESKEQDEAMLEMLLAKLNKKAIDA